MADQYGMGPRTGYRPPYTDKMEATPYSIPAIAGRMGPDIARALMAIPDAAADIWANYRPGPENEPLNMDVGRRGATAIMGLSPGFFRAAGGMAANELGIAAGKVLQRTDAMKMIRELRAAGQTDRQIAAALNERFAPLLDEGAEVTKGMVVGKRQRDIELGAMGGRSGEAGRVTADDVTRIAEELGLSARVRNTAGGTDYVKLNDPVADPHKQAILEVRIPSEAIPHGGKPRAHMIDTSTAKTVHPTPSQYDLAGDAFEGNLPAVRSRIEYAFGKQRLEPGSPPSMEGGPITDPRQLRLLSGSIPFGMNGANQQLPPDVVRALIENQGAY